MSRNNSLINFKYGTFLAMVFCLKWVAMPHSSIFSFPKQRNLLENRILKYYNNMTYILRHATFVKTIQVNITYACNII